MPSRLFVLAAAALLAGGGAAIAASVAATPDPRAARVPPQRPAASAPAADFCATALPSANAAAPDSLVRPLAPLVATPEPLRGLYVNRWAALGSRMWQLVDIARRTEVNALVIDVKDDRGLVLYRSRVPLAREIAADTTMPMSPARLRAVIDSMRVHGIYPIARIVVAKDPLLAERKLEWAVKRRDAPASPWLDKNGKPWLDPHQDGPWHYAAALACEAVSLGFSEIQFDYVRFPDEDRMWREAVFPLARGRERAQVVREQLMTTRGRLRSLGVPVTIDVFGLTATDTTDMGIGQKWELFVDAADAVLPMMYPSHYAPGTYRIGNPNARPYETIDRGLRDVTRRTKGIAGAAKVIPWYQDFTLGPPRYGPAQVRAQIEAGYANGYDDWVLWNPGSRYTEGALK